MTLSAIGPCGTVLITILASLLCGPGSVGAAREAENFAGKADLGRSACRETDVIIL